MMTQVFLIGSSLVYGVGSTNGGWAGLVKEYLHAEMYDTDGVGEKYEVYNFGKSGATLDFIATTFPELVKSYGRGQKLITIFCPGGNNAKADDQPDNFSSTPEQYEKDLQAVLTLLKKHSDVVIMLGSGPAVDETKTNPKKNPLTGGLSYFTNQRREQFAEVAKKLCADNDIEFVEVHVPAEKWLQNYLYKDGLHPNNAGYQLLFEAIKPSLDANLA